MKIARESFHQNKRKKKVIAKHDGRHSVFFASHHRNRSFGNHGSMPQSGIAPHPIMFCGTLSRSGRIFSLCELGEKISTFPLTRKVITHPVRQDAVSHGRSKYAKTWRCRKSCSCSNASFRRVSDQEIDRSDRRPACFAG